MILAVIHAVQKHQSILDIAITIKNLKVLDLIDSAYVQQSTYWLTFFPFVISLSLGISITNHSSSLCRLRGFLVIFDLAQLLNLFLVSVKTRSVLVMKLGTFPDKWPCPDSLDARPVIIESSRSRPSSSFRSISE
jgi:hypothetical protein